MQKMIHIGNFQKRNPKVLTGHNAKMSINGKEVIRFNDANYFSGVDYSIGGDISAMHVLGDFHPKEIVPPPSIEDRIVDFAKNLSQAIERDLFEGGGSSLVGVCSPEECRLALETFKEAAKLCSENLGNELHVDMNLLFPNSINFIPNSINFIPLNIGIDHLKTQFSGSSIGPQEVKCSNPIIHIGNFKEWI